MDSARPSTSSAMASSSIVSTEPDSKESSIFRTVKPLCIDILKTPSCSNLKELSDLLEGLPSEQLEIQLIEYILFPISIHLKMTDALKQSVRVELFKCLKVIVAKWELTSLVMFLELFHRLNMALGSLLEPTKLNEALPEEVMEPIVECIHELVKRSLSCHVEQLYSTKYAPSIGHCVFMILQIITFNTTIRLRSTALNILHILINSCDGNIEASHQIFKFIPGIASGLRKVCSIKSGKHYKQLVLLALNVFKTAVSVTVKAETAETLQVADMNLSTVFREISDSFMVSESEEIRRGLMDFTMDLLQPLSTKMPICSDIIWNNVFVLVCDSNTQFAQNCLKLLLSSSTKQSLKTSFYNFETLLDLTKRARTVIKSHDNVDCILLLKRIASTLILVKLTTEELGQFFPILVDIVSNSLVGGTTSKILENELELKKENKVRLVCSQICSNLTLRMELGDILDALSEFLKSANSENSISNCTSAALIFCINNVISATKITSTEWDLLGYNCIRREMESNEALAAASTYVTLLSQKPGEVESKDRILKRLEGMDLTPDDDDDDTNITPKFELSQGILTMYLLEGLEVLLAVDPESSHPFMLPDVLYVLLEHADRQDYPFVGAAALQTIQSISRDKSIKAILDSNLDLILMELRMRIKRVNKGGISYRYPDALIFLAKYFDFSQVGFAKFVEDIFFQSDSHQNILEEGKRQVLYAQLFFALISSLWNHTVRQETFAEAEMDVRADKERKSLLVRLLDYQRSVGMSMEDVSEIDEPEEDKSAGADPPKEDEEGEKKLPANPSLALKISHRTLHFLPLDNRNAKLLAMDILIKGVQILIPHEDSLLPLAHQIWDFLVPRFEEADYVVVRKSFELLLTMCSASKSFLKKRTLVDVFPKLATLLKKLAEQSRKVKDKNRVYYTTTQGYKLQLCMLEGMAELCKSIEILETDLDKVADGCLLYLTPEQHKNLRDAASKLLKDLSNTTYGSTIWMKLVANGLSDTIHCQEASSPHPSFKTMPSNMLTKIPSSSKKSKNK